MSESRKCVTCVYMVYTVSGSTVGNGGGGGCLPFTAREEVVGRGGADVILFQNCHETPNTKWCFLPRKDGREKEGAVGGSGRDK